MTNPEFSIEFDILYNNISSNKAPGLNEYEKSVFLTKAQEQIVTELYSGRNTTYSSFEETEELRRYLSSLIVTMGCSPYSGEDKEFIRITNNSMLFDIPEDVLFLVKEVIVSSNNSEIDVCPVSQDELSKI